MQNRTSSLEELGEETSLHLAAKALNHDDICKLIDEGADVNARSSNGETPLHYAAKAPNLISRSYHLSCITELVEKGADINAVCNNGKTPLYHVLTAYCRPKENRHNSSIYKFTIVKFLLENDAKFDEAHIEPRLLSEYVNLEGHKELADIINQRKLADYILKNDRRDPNHYKTSINFGLFKINFGYDARTKVEAAKKLQGGFRQYLAECSLEGDRKLQTYCPQKGALDNGELGEIYTKFNQRQI